MFYLAENNDSGDTKQTQLVKKLENGQTNKRNLENPVTVVCTKKPKLINTLALDLSIQLKDLKGMSKKKLEELCLKVFCDVCNDRSEIDELARKLKQADQEIKSMQEKLRDLDNQVQKLSFIQRNVSKALQTPNRNVVSVYKIQRTVGIQVNQPLTQGTNSIMKKGPNSLNAQKRSISYHPVQVGTIKIIDLTDEDTSTSTAGSGQMLVPYRFGNNNQQANTSVMQSTGEATPKIVNKPSTPKGNNRTNNLYTCIYIKIKYFIETHKAVVLSTVSHAHPAPLPTSPLVESSNRQVASILELKIHRNDGKVFLTWGMPRKAPSLCKKIVRYQLYCYKETNDAPSAAGWWKVDEFAAHPLPMRYFLYQCDAGKHYFAVRGIDVQSRIVALSSPARITFNKAYNMHSFVVNIANQFNIDLALVLQN